MYLRWLILVAFEGLYVGGIDLPGACLNSARSAHDGSGKALHVHVAYDSIADPEETGEKAKRKSSDQCRSVDAVLKVGIAAEVYLMVFVAGE
eukprot:Clim_evm2s31 gene=Clim_evmTU2s31